MTTATEEPFAHGFALRHWRRDVGASDRALLRHCLGATIDIGCGPGRMSEHLVRRGHTVLAIDVDAEAVAQARARGVAALVRDVFSPLPGEGRWETALLAEAVGLFVRSTHAHGDRWLAVLAKEW